MEAIAADVGIPVEQVLEDVVADALRVRAGPFSQASRPTGLAEQAGFYVPCIHIGTGTFIDNYVYPCPAEWGGAPWPADLGTWGGGRGRVATTLPRSRSQTRVVVVVTHPRLRATDPPFPSTLPHAGSASTGGSLTGAAIRL